MFACPDAWFRYGKLLVVGCWEAATGTDQKKNCESAL